MPRAITYTADILNDLPLKEVERLVNQQAERYNKQITRAKQQGLNTGAYFTDLQRAKVHRGGKPPAMKADVYKRQLIRQYKQTETRLKGGVTKSNIKRLSEKKKGYEKEYGTDDLSTEQFEKLYEIEEASKTKGELYYQHLLEAEKKGVASRSDYKRTQSTESIIADIEKKLTEYDKLREPEKTTDYSNSAYWEERSVEYRIAQQNERGKFTLPVKKKK